MCRIAQQAELQVDENVELLFRSELSRVDGPGMRTSDGWCLVDVVACLAKNEVV